MSSGLPDPIDELKAYTYPRICGFDQSLFFPNDPKKNITPSSSKWEWKINSVGRLFRSL